MDNPKVSVEDNRFGKALVAAESIEKGEVIAEFDGEKYVADKATDLPKEVVDHAIQFEEHKWRDSNGIARYINHSCEPNCGIKDLFTLVAMRNIKKGEELLWDYDMTEDSDWRLKCLCNPLLAGRLLVHSRVFLRKREISTRATYLSGWLRNMVSPVQFDFAARFAYISEASQGALFFSGPATDTLEN